MIDTNSAGFVARHYDVFYQELVGPLQPLAQFDDASGLNWGSRLGCTSLIRKSDCQRHCKELRCALHQAQPRLIVELGCGLGGYGVHLAKTFDADLLGIDVSPVAVRLAQDEAAKSDTAGRYRFKKASIERTGLATDSVAAIIAIDSIYFLRNRPAVAWEVARLLRPGGVLIATLFETAPGPSPEVSWVGAFMQRGFAVAARRDVTRSWRTYMLEKHTLRWQSRKLLVEQCGPSVEPHLEVSQSIVETSGECLAHLRRWELCLRKPEHQAVAVGSTRASKRASHRTPSINARPATDIG